MSPKHKGREEHAGAAFAWKVFCKIFNPSLHREVVRQLEGLLSLNCVVVRRMSRWCGCRLITLTATCTKRCISILCGVAGLGEEVLPKAWATPKAGQNLDGMALTLLQKLFRSSVEDHLHSV